MMTSSSNTPSANLSSTTFYRLKVEDALSYLDQVKLQFSRQPDVYNQFLDIMKEFKSQSIDTPGVISRVSSLFRGHAELIEGFNTFLPPGYKIEVHANEAVHVTSPHSQVSTILQHGQVTTRIEQPPKPNPTAIGVVPVASATPATHVVSISTLQGATPTQILTNPTNQIKLEPVTLLNNNATAVAAAVSAASTATSSSSTTGTSLPSAASALLANTTRVLTQQPTGTPTQLVVHPIQSRFISATTTNGEPCLQTATIQTQHLSSVPTVSSTTSSSAVASASIINPSHHLIAQTSQPITTPPPPPPTPTPTPSQMSHLQQAQQQQQQQQASQTTAITTTAQPQNQVEFGHAINYVNKIKNRFSLQPEIYKAFLDILHTYQKQQKCLKEGTVQPGHTLTEAEVYEKVANLFKDQDDLLAEFSQFLPDANNSAQKVQQNQQHASGTASSTSLYSSSSSSSSQTGVTTTATTGGGSATAAGGTFTSTKLSHQHLDQQIASAATAHHQQQQQQQLTNQQTTPSITTKQMNTQSSAKSTTLKYNYPQTKSKQANNQENQTTPSTTTPSTTATTTTNTRNSTNLTSKNNSTLLNTPNTNHLSSSNNNLNNNNNNNRNSTAINTPSHTVTSTGSVKRASSNHQLSSKKQKIQANKANANALSNININNNNITEPVEVYYINETTFFDHVKRVLRTPEVYRNFLRCISLYNQEVITCPELIKVVEPFLGKFPDLYRWFKSYVGDRSEEMKNDRYSTMAFTSHSQSVINRSNLTNSNNRIDIPFTNENISLEIDYSSCKQHGTSYREINAYPQAVCSGRTALCKEVLNDTFVSFPCWSEDSTFVTSKKNQYEELLFRCEDERFELDVILETNMSAIRVLESLQKKISKMSPEEKNSFRLDNTLANTSEILQFKAFQRVYGEKAKDFMEGLKKNPVVTVPLILKRLKSKDEEWRESKKLFEQMWREQVEKNYLKSLDHCAGTFKQNDQKHLRTKSLLTEIEAIYYERQEAKEAGKEIPQSPHLTFVYQDKTILEDAAALIIHHAKRQMGIQKEDKQKIKQIIYHFLPDLFFVPRGALSDDEADDDNEDSQQSNMKQKRDKKPARHTDTNKRRLTDVDDKPKDVPEEYKSPEDMYRLFFVNDHWYYFFRYHQLLCERLHNIYKHSLIATEQEYNEAKTRGQSVAEALKLRNKCKMDTAVGEYYPTFLDIVRNLLDGSIDSGQYEDTLREMFGIHAYIAFTLDKLVQNCARQLQHLVQEDTCSAIRHYYLEEQKSNTNGCKVAHMQFPSIQNTEFVYQKRIEAILQDQNCFKIISYKNSGRLTIELLDTESTENENETAEIEKWSEYVEKYCNDENNQISEEIKESLLNKPIFLTRNAHYLKQKYPDEEKIISDNNIEIYQNEECKFEPFSYKFKRRQNCLTYALYRKNSIKNARKSHHAITKTMYDTFKKYLNKWLKENSDSAPTNDKIDSWLMGNNPDTASNIKTTCAKETSLKRAPYHAYYKYKTINNSSNSGSSTNSNNNASGSGSGNGNNNNKQTKSSKDNNKTSQKTPLRTPTPTNATTSKSTTSTSTNNSNNTTTTTTTTTTTSTTSTASSLTENKTTPPSSESVDKNEKLIEKAPSPPAETAAITTTAATIPIKPPTPTTNEENNSPKDTITTTTATSTTESIVHNKNTETTEAPTSIQTPPPPPTPPPKSPSPPKVTDTITTTQSQQSTTTS